ncbi:MAG: ElyC/SanA/YdcF family protein [Verrucomicrobiota bacterium]
MSFPGLTKRKECCVPTLRGWLVLVLMATLTCAWTFKAISPFLAPNRPVESHILAVEGWLPDYALEQTLAEFRKNHYELLMVTGPPLELGYYLFEYKTYADLGTATLKRLGLEEKMLVAVPSAHTQKDRTFTSGLALKQWLKQNRPSINAVNVVTLGVHARRTWLLFEKALGPDYSVGIIAATDRDYDSRRWWSSSYGVRSVVGEVIAYVYARFLFSPKA